MPKSTIELADVIKTFGKKLMHSNKLAPQHTKVLHNILRCRTAALGGHKEACDVCGVIRIRYSYNSCRDRHCPKCQLGKQTKWVEKLQDEVLPVKHYHIIFTVPHSLNDVCLWNNKLYYNLLFKATWDTLRSFGYTKYGVESGAVAVLHTWGQNLSLHPHIHCIVPAAGFSIKGKWKHIGKNDRYLYPVKQLSSAFKGKFLDSLKRKLAKLKHTGFKTHIEKAYNSNWVVYCEAPMAGVNQVIKYLGQYTHRIAISNQRLKQIHANKVHFLAKDYRDNATHKLIQMEGVEFLRRFIQHILPKGFVRIRRFGIYNATVKRNLDLQFFVPDSSFLKLLKEKEKKEGSELIPQRHCCPVCKQGKMIPFEEIPRIRSSAGHLPSMLSSLLL